MRQRRHRRGRLNDSLGYRAKQGACDEIAASSPNDHEIGGHLTGSIDQHHGRVPCRRSSLEHGPLPRAEELSGLLHQARRVERAVTQWLTERRGAHVWHDCNDDDRHLAHRQPSDTR